MGTTATAEAELEITEFEEMDVELVNGVATPANGTPHLLMKGLAAGQPPSAAQAGESAHDLAVKAVMNGKVDEAPDISLARQIMHLLGQAIASEAEEISAGSYGEVKDVGMLSRASEIIATWQAREEATAAGADPDAPCGCCDWCRGMGCGCCGGCGYGVVMCSAAEEAAKSSAAINDLPDSAFAYIEDGGEKDESGKTTPRSKRHFPVHDEKHARLAVQMLPTSPFGPKAKGKIMAAAKKYGIETASDDGKAGKGAQVAPDGGTVDTATQGSDADAEMAKAVADAVTEATRPVLDRLAAKETELDGLLAKVKATPIPGGPVLSAAALGTRAALAGDEDHAAKAAYYADRAETVDDPKLAAGYRKLASQAAEKAGITTAP